MLALSALLPRKGLTRACSASTARFVTAAALVLALGASPALADGTATVEAGTPQGPVQMTMSWLDAGAVRIDMTGQPVYTLLKDGKAYAVTDMNGQPMVMDLTGVVALGNQMAGNAKGGAGAGGGLSLDSALASSVEALRPTGRHESVAGIDGEVYSITWTDRAGKSHTDEAVLSHDPLVRDFARAFQTYSDAVTGVPDPRGKAITDQGLGLLRYGDTFHLTSVSAQGAPQSSFELPAPPMDMQQMMQGLMKH